MAMACSGVLAIVPVTGIVTPGDATVVSTGDALMTTVVSLAALHGLVTALLFQEVFGVAGRRRHPAGTGTGARAGPAARGLAGGTRQR